MSFMRRQEGLWITLRLARPLRLQVAHRVMTGDRSVVLAQCVPSPVIVQMSQRSACLEAAIARHYQPAELALCFDAAYL